VISEIALNNGYIIATGGGAILRPHNVKALAHNGVLVFIDRPLKDLIPTDDRPTASDVDMLKKRYEERYDIYTDISDIHIKVTGDAASVADKIAEMIGF
jgi:shikimate kinase